LTLDDINLQKVVNIPFKISPRGKQSETLCDFHNRFSEWVNYLSEALLFSHLANKNSISNYSEAPKIEKHNKKGYISVPIITVTSDDIDSISENLIKSIFHNAISLLVTNYEVFLNEITRDILWANTNLLAIDEKQFTTKQIFEFEFIDEIENHLIEKVIMNQAMSSYPKRVDTFQKKYHIGLHSKHSPVTMAELHDVIEIRNLIQHNFGKVNDKYNERMQIYDKSKYTRLISANNHTLQVDFAWLFSFGEKMLELAEFIEIEVLKKWEVARQED